MASFKDFRRAAAQAGRPLPDVLLEALSLRMAPGHLGFAEYLYYNLHLTDLSPADKRCFAGAFAADALKDVVADERARFLCRDKLTTYALLRGHGLPFPPVRAVYRSRRPSSTTCLHTAAELMDYLRDPKNLPVYLKPSWGSHGEQNALLVACEGDVVTLGDGSRVALVDFVGRLDSGRTLGWILQEPMRAHPDLEALTGTDKVSSIRLCSVHDGQDVHPYLAILKVNRGDRDNDDFIHGTLGNAAAAIDVRTGRLMRTVSGTPGQEVVNPLHPKTQREITGFQIPMWEEVLTLVHDAHRALPTMICPHWDIAVTDRGVRIIEINSFGSLGFIQRAHRHGFMTERLVEWLRLRADRGMLDPDMLRMDPLSWKRRSGLVRRYWQWRNRIPARDFAAAGWLDGKQLRRATEEPPRTRPQAVIARNA